MAIFYKTAWKYVFGFIAIISFSLVVLYFTNYYFNPEERASRAAEKELENIQRAYEQDIYGGQTPEETLELFILALEKGDIELASKYFVVDEQEKYKKGFEMAVSNGTNKDLLNIFKNYKQKGGVLSENRFIVNFIDDNNIADFSVTFIKYPQGIWKIEDL